MNPPPQSLPKPLPTQKTSRRPTESVGSNGATGSGISAAERAALKVFSDFHVGLGEMFCFQGNLLDKHRNSLVTLVGKDLLVKEQFTSGYSLTPLGHRAMIDGNRAGKRTTGRRA